MKRLKWFERKFDFSFEQNILPSLVGRLRKTPLLLNTAVKEISATTMGLQLNGKWSIKEHIGHLIDLEPLWQGRLTDILDGKEFLRPTDLDNQKTHEAGHNQTETKELLSTFEVVRTDTIALLEGLSEQDVFKSALHPRLLQPMRAMDLFLFVAEHDDHHLDSIAEIKAASDKLR